jgi:hypothetical protein
MFGIVTSRLRLVNLMRRPMLLISLTTCRNRNRAYAIFPSGGDSQT